MRSGDRSFVCRYVTAVFLLVAAAVCVGAPRASAIDLSTLLGGKREARPFKIIHVEQLARMMENSKSRPLIYDANLPEVRARYGVIPGARLLSSYNRYNVKAELPANHDALIIFYCTDSH